MQSRKQRAGTRLQGQSAKSQSGQSPKRLFPKTGLFLAAIILSGSILPGIPALPVTALAEEAAPAAAMNNAGAEDREQDQNENQNEARNKGQAAAAVPAGRDALHLPAITDFAPGTVWSGTIGELTRLQAGQEMARAALSLREIQARILETESSMARVRREMEKARDAEEEAKTGTAEGQPSGQNAKTSLRQSVEELRAGLDALAGDVAALRLDKQKAQSCLVLSVRSQGQGLVAEIATREGRFLAGPGDHVPGVGTIESVSRSKVTAGGKSLPWK